MIKRIESGDSLLAVHVTGNWDDGLKFYSDDNDFIQAGTWRYKAGTILRPHRHNRVERTVTHTQEVVYVKRGRLRATVYDQDGNEVDRVEAKEGDFLIMLAGGHGYDILEEDTQVLEVKNGPYVGAERDRTRL